MINVQQSKDDIWFRCVLSAPAVATVGLEQPVGGREYTLPTVVQNFLLEVGATIEGSFW